MPRSLIFPVVIEEDRFENGREAWHAWCPALRGCHTWGHSYQEALANVREAIELYVEDLLESGEPIPVDRDAGVVELSEPAVAINL